MKREFVTDKTIMEIQQWLRRINARLIRLVPKTLPHGNEGYIVYYIM